MLSEPFKLIGEGEYNLDNLKEIKITDSYLGLDQDVRKCQNEESLFSCTTRQYYHAEVWMSAIEHLSFKTGIKGMGMDILVQVMSCSPGTALLSERSRMC